MKMKIRREQVVYALVRVFYFVVICAGMLGVILLSFKWAFRGATHNAPLGTMILQSLLPLPLAMLPIFLRLTRREHILLMLPTAVPALITALTAFGATHRRFEVAANHAYAGIPFYVLLITFLWRYVKWNRLKKCVCASLIVMTWGLLSVGTGQEPPPRKPTILDLPIRFPG